MMVSTAFWKIFCLVGSRDSFNLITALGIEKINDLPSPVNSWSYFLLISHCRNFFNCLPQLDLGVTEEGGGGGVGILSRSLCCVVWWPPCHTCDGEEEGGGRPLGPSSHSPSGHWGTALSFHCSGTRHSKLEKMADNVELKEVCPVGLKHMSFSFLQGLQAVWHGRGRYDHQGRAQEAGGEGRGVHDGGRGQGSHPSGGQGRQREHRLLWVLQAVGRHQGRGRGWFNVTIWDKKFQTSIPLPPSLPLYSRNSRMGLSYTLPEWELRQ